MSILSRVVGDIESAVNPKAPVATGTVVNPQAQGSIPQGVESMVNNATGRPANFVPGVPMASERPVGVPPELLPLAAQPPRGAEPNSYALGLQAGHNAALSVLPNVAGTVPVPAGTRGLQDPGQISLSGQMPTNSSLPLFTNQ